jgi:ketol-acid reductoisomerase
MRGIAGNPTCEPEILTSRHASLLAPLHGSSVTVVGYGNQGRAHALNLRDSGVSVNVAGRAGGAGIDAARSEGFRAGTIEEMVPCARLVIVSLPDEVHESACPGIERLMAQSATMGFLHGTSVHFGLFRPPPGRTAVMVAPKGPGTTLRARFLEGHGIPALYAVAHDGGDPDAARALALAWGAGIGCARAGLIATTFREEAETDLFGEQAVLCGGVIALVRAAYETLVDAGYPPLLAYIECCHELKQVTDLVHDRGIAGMRAAISNTAEAGADEAMAALDDAGLRARMRAILERVRSGDFVQALARDARAGFPALMAARQRAAAHPMEESGRAVRALLPWLRKDA